MEQYKKAFRAAEQELEEKDIERLKAVVKNLLQRKKDKEQEKDDIEEEIRILKQEIEDFKAGRLDKIKERHDVNPEADRVSPVRITIINDNSRTVYPTQPWRWNYEVIWTTSIPGTIGSYGLTATGLNNQVNAYCVSSPANSITASGQSLATFTSGTYDMGNGNFINL